MTSVEISLDFTCGITSVKSCHNLKGIISRKGQILTKAFFCTTVVLTAACSRSRMFHNHYPDQFICMNG